MRRGRILNWVSATGLALALALIAGCGRQKPREYSLNTELVGDYKCEAWDVYVQDNYAFLATKDKGLFILDVSQPRTPTAVSSYIPGDIPKAVKVKGNYAYLLTDTGQPPYGNARFHIIDVTDPHHPKKLGECYLGASSADALFIKDSYAYIGSGDFYVVNIADASSPVIEKSRDLGGGVTAIAVSDSLAYCAVYSPDRETKLVVVDISTPSEAGIVSSYEVSQRASYPYTFAFDLGVKDSSLFVATERGLQVIDISAPSRPKELSFYPLYRYPLSFSALQVADAYVYLTYCTTGLEIIDVSNPVQPSEVGYYDLPGRDVARLYVKGRYIYVASFCGLYIFQFSG